MVVAPAVKLGDQIQDRMADVKKTCRVKDWRGIVATRLQPLPLRTAREVFPQAAHPISFVNRVRRPMAVADPFSDIRRRF